LGILLGCWVRTWFYFHLPLLTWVLALVYNGVNATIDHARGRHDAFGSIAAGGITGALYKSTGNYNLLRFSVSLWLTSASLAGVKPAVSAAVIMSGMAGIWSYVKKIV